MYTSSARALILCTNIASADDIKSNCVTASEGGERSHQIRNIDKGKLAFAIPCSIDIFCNATLQTNEILNMK